MPRKNKNLVEVDIRKLEEVANYYQFPMTVFFTPLGYLKGTRKEKFADAYKKLCKIKEIIEADED